MQFEPEPEDEWQAHCRNVVAMGEGETTPEEPVMAGEVVPVEAEAESEPVVAGEVVPEIVEGEEGVVAEPVVASETMARDAPAEGSTRGSVEATGKGKNRPPSPAPTASASSTLLITSRSACVTPGPPLRGILSPPHTSMTYTMKSASSREKLAARLSPPDSSKMKSGA